MRLNKYVFYSLIAAAALTCVILVILIIRVCVRRHNSKLRKFRMNGSQDKLTSVSCLPHNSSDTSPIYINT